MKKALVLIIWLIIGMALFYFYQPNSEFRATIDKWLQQYSSSGKEITPKTQSPETRKENKRNTKRERIPKKLKPDQFHNLDKYARNTPEKHARDIEHLAAYLKIPAKNDLEKARLAYTWIATHIRYDDEGYNTGIFKDELSADSVLHRRTAVCEGYSTLFMELALKMDLDAVKIIGYAKGYGPDQFKEPDHAWNAVKIDSQWKLIDATWGSGPGQTVNNKLVSESRFEPYWFCVEPKEFIFSHFPEIENWQLTSPKITLKQFEKFPRLSSAFFKLGFDSETVFNRAVSGELKLFVQTYAPDLPVKVIDIPLDKELTRGQDYSFIIESDYAEEIAIIDDKQWTYLKKENNSFSIRYTPAGDEIQIAVKINWFDEGYSTIAAYDVTENHLAQNKHKGIVTESIAGKKESEPISFLQPTNRNK